MLKRQMFSGVILFVVLIFGALSIRYQNNNSQKPPDLEREQMVGVNASGDVCVVCGKPVGIYHMQELQAHYRAVPFCSRCYMKQTPKTLKEF